MKHPVDAHVGKRLRHRRWMVGMTQQQLGDAVGIKFQQIQKYETGMNRVSASRLWELANALNVPVSYFFDDISEEAKAHLNTDIVNGNGAGPETENMPPVNFFRDKEALELVRSYYNIPEAQRKRFFELARSMGHAA